MIVVVSEGGKKRKREIGEIEELLSADITTARVHTGIRYHNDTHNDTHSTQCHTVKCERGKQWMTWMIN